MIAKLTLTIDEQVVRNAKLYAKKKNRSVSGLVEEYLRTIAIPETATIDGTAPRGPITESVTGMFKDEYRGQEYRELIEAALLERFE